MGKSPVTDQPHNPIDESPETPPDATADPAEVETGMPPTSVGASDPAPPAEVEQTETPTEAEPTETPAEAEPTETPAEAAPNEIPAAVKEDEVPAETEQEAPAEVESPERVVDTGPPEGRAKKGAAAKSAESDPSATEPKSDKMDWFILKVQSNREESIRDGLMRRVAIAGLESYFGDVIVPTEKVTEFKGGKRRVTKRKLYPGYLVVQMEINDDTWFLVRETPGIGDFTGAGGHPTPIQPHEVARILARQEEKHDEAPKLKIAFNPGDRVKINEGTFENFEGEVDAIDETNGRVTVMINIFGRSTPVELEYWQIETI